MLKVNVIMISFIYCSGAINSLRKNYTDCFYLRSGKCDKLGYLLSLFLLLLTVVSMSFI